jgi:hypothetical protein
MQPMAPMNFLAFGCFFFEATLIFFKGQKRLDDLGR